MKQLTGIIESPYAPPTNCIWLSEGKLKYFSNGAWISIGKSGDTPSNESYEIITIGDNSINLQTAQRIGLNNAVTIKFKGSDNGTYYDTLAYYQNGIINVLKDNSIAQFNLNFNTGKVERSKESLLYYKLDSFMLEIGDIESVRTYNLETIQKALAVSENHFFCHIDYGFGVATWNPTNGGFAHVTTAYGQEVFYNIGVDGSIIKDEEYIKPNTPYTIVLEDSQIGVMLDDITASAVQRCGEIIINGSTGPITYTRSVDSTPAAIHFTSSKKNDTLQVLTYTVSNKIFSSAIVSPSIPEATTRTLGGVKKVQAIADIVASSATAESVAMKLNDVLAALRTAGLLSV